MFMFNVNSQASLCVQYEIIPNLESDNPDFFSVHQLDVPLLLSHVLLFTTAS